MFVWAVPRRPLTQRMARDSIVLMPEPRSLIAGRKGNGDVVHEQVLVERVSDGVFELVKSPGLVLGVAAGDHLFIAADGSFDILKRGMNVAVQLFGDDPAGNAISHIESVLSEGFRGIGGRLDGRADRLLVYTVPVRAGFPKIERVLNDAVARVQGVNWFFGNVYDIEDGVTPLNWWQS